MGNKVEADMSALKIRPSLSDSVWQEGCVKAGKSSV